MIATWGRLSPAVLIATLFLTAQSNAQSSNPQDVCPSQNGTVYQSTSSTPRSYRIFCAADMDPGADLGITQTDDQAGCVAACDNTSGCVAVTYVGTGPINCYFHSRFVATKSSTVDGTGIAVLTSTYQDAISVCPDYNNTIYTNRNSNDYYIFCDTDMNPGGVSLGNFDHDYQCIGACDSSSSCIGVTIVNGACYSHPSYENRYSAPGHRIAVQRNALPASEVPPAPSSSTSTSSTGNPNDLPGGVSTTTTTTSSIPTPSSSSVHTSSTTSTSAVASSVAPVAASSSASPAAPVVSNRSSPAPVSSKTSTSVIPGAASSRKTASTTTKRITTTAKTTVKTSTVKKTTTTKRKIITPKKSAKKTSAKKPAKKPVKKPVASSSKKHTTTKKRTTTRRKTTRRKTTRRKTTRRSSTSSTTRRR